MSIWTEVESVCGAKLRRQILWCCQWLYQPAMSSCRNCEDLEEYSYSVVKGNRPNFIFVQLLPLHIVEE